MNAKEIGMKLYSLRTQANETQEEVAASVGINQAAYGRYENGIRLPKIDILSRIAAHFNISIDELTGHTTEQGEDSNEPLSAVDFALSGEIHDLTEAEKQDVLDYVRFKRSQRRKEE